MHSFEQIIENQKKFKDVIISSFLNDYKDAKKQLEKMDPKDEFFKKKKKDLLEKFEKINVEKYLDRLFFMNKNRSKNYYIFWNEKNEEYQIIKYGKR